MQLNKLAAALLVAGVALPGAAFATNGYFQPGFSVKSVGMGGVGIAFPQDAMAAAINPAGMVEVGNRVDFGVSLFRPDRSASVNGTFMGNSISGTYSGNDKKNFLIPEFGYNHMLSPTMSLGVSVFGNGGLNTGYSTIFQPFASGMGVDMQQLFIAPTFAMKINANNAIGITANLVHQSFRANGLGALCNMMSADPQNCTDNGHDDSNGAGFRLGWIGRVTPSLSLGATYQSKTSMQGFSKYRGLFANAGQFDIPSNYGIGFAWQANDAVTVAGDYMRIKYSDVPAIANGPNPGGPLGGDPNGPGFSWQDINVFKLGVAWRYSEALQLRAGWNHGDNPVDSSNILFNTLAPGVVTDHLTLGATYALNPDMELSFDYVHAFRHSVTGPLPASFGFTGTETLSMSQDVLGVSIGWKY
ncbi:outer membrane protein transport protein (OMPP1/FadL/TodX) [mine drainage metagenome]|jgi:long-chain fatty acid transport protein|uniref:Outer membrane protein transport protein (OMPP1/FadL/TodX) n=1 Tax=mine drainage metagenome TaxID=410659 RepID=A0A1J5QH96_9ZZZZ